MTAPLARRVFLSVGRTVPQCDFDDLLRFFSQLEKGTLVILGAGRLREMLEVLAADLGISNRVMMPSFVHEPQQVLLTADN